MLAVCPSLRQTELLVALCHWMYAQQQFLTRSQLQSAVSCLCLGMLRDFSC